MRICRFDADRIGLVEGDAVVDVTDALSLPSCGHPLPRHDLLIEHLDQVRQAARSGRSAAVPLAQVRLLSPVANPGKIIAAPVNYQAHLDEAVADGATFHRSHVRRIQETGLFLKATSSLVGAGSAIRIGLPARRTDHEIELVAVIGTTCRNVTRADALRHVAGYTVGLDSTIRGPEERLLRKSLDTYSVLGPVPVTADEFGDPSGHDLLLTVNGEVRQRANTADLIMDIPALIEFASSFYTLHPGDILFTGTPEGVGPIAPEDRIRATIDGIGELAIDVVGE